MDLGVVQRTPRACISWVHAVSLLTSTTPKEYQHEPLHLWSGQRISARRRAITKYLSSSQLHERDEMKSLSRSLKFINRGTCYDILWYHRGGAFTANVTSPCPTIIKPFIKLISGVAPGFCLSIQFWHPRTALTFS